jgi:hypothetical protein
MYKGEESVLCLVAMSEKQHLPPHKFLLLVYRNLCDASQDGVITGSEQKKGEGDSRIGALGLGGWSRPFNWAIHEHLFGVSSRATSAARSRGTPMAAKQSQICCCARRPHCDPAGHRGSFDSLRSLRMTADNSGRPAQPTPPTCRHPALPDLGGLGPVWWLLPLCPACD